MIAYGDRGRCWARLRPGKHGEDRFCKRLVSCVRHPQRYEWADDGIWDNRRGCWIVWRTIGGTWATTDEFRARVVRAINEHPATTECPL